MSILFPIRPYRRTVGDRLLLFREAEGGIYGCYERRTEEDGYTRVSRAIKKVGVF